MSPTPQTPPTDRPLTAGDVPLLREGDVLIRRDGRIVRLDFVYEDGLSGTYDDGSTFANSPPSHFTFVSRHPTAQPMRLVPVEITGPMMVAGCETLPNGGTLSDARKVWSAMLAAARPATSAASEVGKFRKRPVVIDAFEMRAEIYGDRSAWPQWLEDAWNLERGAEGSIQNYGVSPLRDGPLQIVTLEGLHNVQVGDWIIRGVKGELYPCKPDVFALTYEPAALASPPVSERERELEGALREAKERIQSWPIDDHETCMCGSLVEGHDIGSGHSPVSQADHAISTIVQEIDQALAALNEQPQ